MILAVDVLMKVPMIIAHRTSTRKTMNLIKAKGIKLLAFSILCSFLATTASFAQESDPPPNEERVFELRARGTTGEEQLRLLIDDQVVATWTMTRSLENYQVTSNLRGPIRAEYINDTRKRDVRVDYLKIDDQIFQAEDQTINTGAFQNGKCGGGQGRTEWMRCQGYIEFQTY